MFKLVVFTALLALAAARPGYLASSPVVLSSHSHYVQPVVSAHYAAPLVKHVVTPVVHTAPVVKTVVAPVVHAPVVKTVVHSAPVVHSFGSPVVHASPLVHSASLVHSDSLYHSYGAASPVFNTYASGYGIWKK